MPWQSLLLLVLILACELSQCERIQRDRAKDYSFYVDAVFTWVAAPGGEAERLDQKEGTALASHRKMAIDEALGNHEAPAVFKDATEPHRFDRHPSMFRHIVNATRTFAPWIRKIYVVLADDDDAPHWLDEKSGGMATIVRHKSIFPHQEDLPTFNSFAIECWLHRIPGLADHFIYLNDDQWFGLPVTKEVFFDRRGRPLLRYDSSIAPTAVLKPAIKASDAQSHRGTSMPNNDLTAPSGSYWKTVAESNAMLRGVLPPLDLQDKEGAFHAPEHQAKALTRSLLERAAVTFRGPFAVTSSSKFRSIGNVWALHLALQLGLADGSVMAIPHFRSRSPLRGESDDIGTEAFLFGMLTPDFTRSRELVEKVESSNYSLLSINFDYIYPSLKARLEADLAEKVEIEARKSYLRTLSPSANAPQLVHHSNGTSSPDGQGEMQRHLEKPVIFKGNLESTGVVAADIPSMIAEGTVVSGDGAKQSVRVRNSEPLEAKNSPMRNLVAKISIGKKVAGRGAAPSAIAEGVSAVSKPLQPISDKSIRTKQLSLLVAHEDMSDDYVAHARRHSSRRGHMPGKKRRTTSPSSFEKAPTEIFSPGASAAPHSPSNLLFTSPSSAIADAILGETRHDPLDAIIEDGHVLSQPHDVALFSTFLPKQYE